MKSFKLYILILVQLTVLCSVYTQQLPQSNLYNYNKLDINTAYVGYEDCLEIYGSHFNKWAGFEDAPTTNYLSVNKRMTENLGFGGQLMQDKSGHIAATSARLSSSYRIRLGTSNHNLRFGLSLGINRIKIDQDGLIVDDLSDDLIENQSSAMTFDNEFGLFYDNQKFQAGISIPQLFQTKSTDSDGYFDLQRHLTIYSGYKLELNDTWNLEPSALFKGNTSNFKLSHLDLNALVTYNDLVSAGFTYRTNSGALAKVGFNIKRFQIGYSYEFPTSGIASYSSGSHELLLGLKFCKKNSSRPNLYINN